MDNTIVFTQVSNHREVGQILELQAQNLAASLTPEVIASQGFVTVKHDPEVLLEMNRAYPSVIAKAGDVLAGYCLVMPREFAPRVPVLAPMFAMLETLSWQGRPLSESRWFVMGQVCVTEAFRGQGVFDGMYRKLREVCRRDFDFVVTEVAERNTRSMRAHQRVGFETIHTYPDDTTGELWHVIAWQF
ncbi:MAG: GNAT family N-acetyltransferase [Thermoanaerobaculia bacterium]|nr:GNAT family N-acetyltransferase [Thermoanaerobaculia bacterium]